MGGRIWIEIPGRETRGWGKSDNYKVLLPELQFSHGGRIQGS